MASGNAGGRSGRASMSAGSAGFQTADTADCPLRAGLGGSAAAGVGAPAAGSMASLVAEVSMWADGVGIGSGAGKA